MAKYRSQEGIQTSSIEDIIKLINAFKGDKDTIKDTYNDIYVIKSMSASSDSISEYDNLLGIIDSKFNANREGESLDLWQNLYSDISQQKQLYIKSTRLPERITNIKNKWTNLPHEKLGELTNSLSKVQDLQKEFQLVYDDYAAIQNTFGKKTNIISNSTERDMDFITKSFDGAIADLLQTKTITSDDWTILQTAPAQLEPIRENKIKVNTAIYNRYSPLYDDMVSVDVDNAIGLVGIPTGEGIATDDVIATAIRNHLSPFIKSAESGVIDDALVRGLTARYKKFKSLGLKEEIEKMKKEFGDIVSNSAEQIRWWGGVDFASDLTSEAGINEALKRKISTSLLNNTPIEIPESFRISTDDNNIQIYTDQNNKEHRVVQQEGGLWLPAGAIVEQKYDIDNPSSNLLSKGKTLPDIAFYLFPHMENTTAGLFMDKESQEILTNRGFPFDNWGGSENGMTVNEFMKEIINLDKLLRNEGAKTIKYEDVDGNQHSFNLEGEYPALDSDGIFRHATHDYINKLSTILKSRKYWINDHTVYKQNINMKKWVNLERALQGSNKK